MDAAALASSITVSRKGAAPSIPYIHELNQKDNLKPCFCDPSGVFFESWKLYFLKKVAAKFAATFFILPIQF